MNSKYIEINKFSHLHKGDSVIFCKTDLILQEFDNIEKQNNEVILITGNSDYMITDLLLGFAPKNIKKWYAQNAQSNSSILEPLPVGLENKFPSVREGHGEGYLERSVLKQRLIEKSSSDSRDPKKFVYANFNISTYDGHRSLIKEISQNTNFIDWGEPNLSLVSFFDKILDYKMIVCPVGNGLDTHRLWEILYCNRTPITFKIGNYK